MNPRELLKIVATVILAGGAAFMIAQKVGSDESPADEIAWLIDEFELNAAQAEQVRELHEAYRPICDAHCQEVMQAQQEVEAAKNAAPEVLAAAQQELEKLKQRCHLATQAHLESVAAVMPPDQGKRYLETITPLLSSHGHSAPFGLR